MNERHTRAAVRVGGDSLAGAVLTAGAEMLPAHLLPKDMTAPPWKGEEECSEARHYREELVRRRRMEAERLASLTGWNIADVRRKMNLATAPATGSLQKWWERIWTN